MSQARAARALPDAPAPDDDDEAWRFTDLAGFDPDAFAAQRRVGLTPAVQQAMLDIDAAGVAMVGEAGIEIEPAPDGRHVRAAHRRPRAARHPRRRRRQVHGPQRGAAGSTDCSSACRRASSSRSRSTCASPTPRRRGSLFWRLLVVAEEGAASRSSRSTSPARPTSPPTRTRPSSSSSSRARSSSTSRCRTTRRRPGTSRRTTRASSATPSSTGSPAASAPARARSRIQNDLAGPGATSRVTGAYFADGTQHLDYDTFQEHIAPNTTSDFAFKGALRDDGHAPSGAG